MIWITIILVIIVIIIFFINFIWWFQYKVIFEPSRDMIWKPDSEYKDIMINTEYPHNSIELNHDNMEYFNGKSYINAWHFNKFEGNKVVLYCHGNCGNISHRSYIINVCDKLKLNCIMFDYRGYGRSSDVPSKDNIRQDGIIVYKYLIQYHDPNNVIIWGESLGGHVATYIASKYKCKGLILLSTFSSLDDVIIYQMNVPILSKIIRKLSPIIIDVLPTKKYIQKVKSPILILHSKDDKKIPYQCSLDLYKNINHSDKEFIWIKGDHALPQITSQQADKLISFIGISLKEEGIKFDITEMLNEIKFIVNTYFRDCINDDCVANN